MCRPLMSLATRKLTTRQISIDYTDHLNDRMFPDHLAGLYVGYHIFPFRHEIQFFERRGNKFRFRWKLEGGEDREICVHHIDVEGVVPFASVSVSFLQEAEELKRKYGEFTPQEFQNAAEAWEPNLEVARGLIASHFDPADFGAPTKWMWNLRYPVVCID